MVQSAAQRPLIVEILEQRLLLSADVSVQDGTLLITAGDGNDSIVVQCGPNGEVLVTIDGQDIALVETQCDQLTGIQINTGDGDDTVDLSAVDGALFPGLDTGPQGGTRITVDGGTGDDHLVGSQLNDSLIGGANDDWIEGGPGNDTLQGGSGGDVLEGQGNDDRLDAGIGDDIIRGGAGDDTLVAGPGADTNDGGTGDDTLEFVHPDEFDGDLDSGIEYLYQAVII